MFRASLILKNTRQEKELELTEVSKKLKISVKYLEAIEGESRSGFPQEPYCSLIIKDYAHFLGLNGDEILSLFRRDFADPQKTSPVNQQKIFFTPQFTFKFGVILSLFVFSAYLILEYAKFNHPPNLKINWPDENLLNKSSLEISGITDPESTIRINNDLVIVDSVGNFQKKINISTPEAKIIVESKSPSGKSTFEEKIYRLSDKPEI